MMKNKAIPLYYQLETILRKRISSGELQPNMLLPGEEALATEFNISRITVRRALESLEKDGILIRQRGRGTFVSNAAPKLDLPRFTGSIEDLITMGIRTQTEVLSSGWVEPSEIISERLKIGNTEKVLRIEKIRSIEGGPFSYVINYLPPAVGKRIPLDLVAKKPMLMILEDDLGIKTTEAEQSMEATIADTEIAKYLDIRVGDPLLKSDRTVFDDKSVPVEYVHVFYRADKYVFTVRLKRKRTKMSAVWNTIP